MTGRCPVCNGEAPLNKRRRQVIHMRLKAGAGRSIYRRSDWEDCPASGMKRDEARAEAAS